MLALTLPLVPAFLLLIALAARRWGPEIAGRPAGLTIAPASALSGGATAIYPPTVSAEP